jgi:hypothetical protein
MNLSPLWRPWQKRKILPKQTSSARGAGLYARMRMEQEKGNLLGVIALENGELKVKEIIQL